MGYTSGTAMDDRGLRDIERWRDKIEVRLDNRQVFFLFFGSALVACMLFVLGVVVGKRLESRGRAVSPEVEDPLALLDKVATSPRPAQASVTFPQALFGNGGKPATDKHAGRHASGVGSDSEPTSKPAAAVEPKSKEAPAKVAVSEPAAEGRPAPAKDSAKADPKPAVPASPSAAKAVESAASKVKLALADSAPSKTTQSTSSDAVTTSKTKVDKAEESKPGAIPTIAASGDSKGKPRFALQLSSFQDKAEAEAFARKFAGEHPYLVISDIPGKGIWYRVRIGDFTSAKDAGVAKQSFEKKHNVIAYVAQK
jgi:DedD protein